MYIDLILTLLIVAVGYYMATDTRRNNFESRGAKKLSGAKK